MTRESIFVSAMGTVKTLSNPQKPAEGTESVTASTEDIGGPIMLGAGTLSTHPIPVTIRHQYWRPLGTGRRET